MYIYLMPTKICRLGIEVSYYIKTHSLWYSMAKVIEWINRE